MMGAIRRGDEAHDGGGCADGMEIVGNRRGVIRCGAARILLQQQSDTALRAHRFLRGCERRVAGDGDGQHDARK